MGGDTQKPRVILKRELGNLPVDILIWVEYRDNLDDWKLDVECFQGISDHQYGSHGECFVCADYMCGYDEVSEYGIEYRFWTERPTWEQMEAEPWEK